MREIKIRKMKKGFTLWVFFERSLLSVDLDENELIALYNKLSEFIST